MWDNFEKLAREVHQCGWRIAIEWPYNCRYWKLKKVRDLLRDCGCDIARIRGCAVGFVDDVGTPIAKPWHVATNDTHLWTALESKRHCPGGARHAVHAECQGKYARASESYTPSMVRLIHNAWNKSVTSQELWKQYQQS